MSRKIAQQKTRQWFVVLATSLVILSGFQALSFSTGIYQIRIFTNLAIALYVFLVFMTTFIFDLRLKAAGSLSQARSAAGGAEKLASRAGILWHALRLRFGYLGRMHHWRHFQNYLILPGFIYWAVAIHIFLNPFSDLLKQAYAIAGSLLLALVFWYIKVVFTDHHATTRVIRSLMFAATIIAAYLVFSALLGVVWYFGLGGATFVLGACACAFFLIYQSLFRMQNISLYTVLLACGGSAITGIAASAIFSFWTVNYHTAGLLLAGFVYLYWGLVSEALEGELTKKSAWEHIGVFLVLLLFVLATTNFHARIG